MDTNDQYFDCLCRTCMNELVEATSYDGNTKPQQQWQSIFDRIEECGAFRIAELLTNAVPQIEVHSRDELPKRICCKCLQELLIVYRFQQMCLQSQEQMRQKVSKKRFDLEISMIGAVMKGELETNTAGSHALKTLQTSSTQQNLEHSSIQESLLETTEQLVKPEAAKTSGDDIDKLLEGCRDAEGNFSEFVKNEPIEDDEPSMEYSDGDTHSIISVKDEGLSVEIVEQQINEPNEDDEPRIEYSGGETTSAISEKDERLSIEFEAQQINETNVKAQRIKHDEDKPYECPYCPRRFRTKQHMFQHKEIHEGVERETCDICGKSVSKYWLRQHKLSHGGEKPHKCHFCEKSFSRMSTLRAHIRKHTGEKPYKCKYCELSFSQNSGRMKHMRLHIGDNVHRCELCPMDFPVASELRAHCITHKDEDPQTRDRNMKALKEAEAELEIKAKEYVKAHHITHVENNECPYCSQSFSTKTQMLKHKEIHKGKNRVACDICGKSISKRCLKEHKLTHGGEKVHKCDLCEKSYATTSHLRVHMRKHTGEKPYKCKYCERSFAHSNSLLHHMRRVHLDDNIHRCELCPLAFPAASELRAHCITHKNEDPETRERNMKALKEAEANLQQLSRQQQEIKPKECKKDRFIRGEDKHYECPHCPQRLRRISSMYHHITTHEGLKGEVCDICGKSVRKSNIKQHKLIHSNEKAHKCDFCEKRFTQMSNLRVHIHTHTGEKPYKCKYCERSYSDQSTRIKHMRVHLGDNVHRCELCPLVFPKLSKLREHFTTHKNEDPETRERNMKALKEAEAKLQQQLVKKAKK